jgi:phage anti-repressor protein
VKFHRYSYESPELCKHFKEGKHYCAFDNRESSFTDNIKHDHEIMMDSAKQLDSRMRKNFIIKNRGYLP